MGANLKKNRIAESELILNPNGSIYHLNLQPHQIAKTIILVGDQERVPKVSKYFDAIDFKVKKREFLTHTGRIGRKKITVISTGIGTDNIDIVLNELDALINIDFKKRIINNRLKQISFIRIGTSGAIQQDIPIDSFLVSEYGLGMDALMPFYHSTNSKKKKEILSRLDEHFQQNISFYLNKAANPLLKNLGKGFLKGITVTAPGFYAPQGRGLRAKRKFPKLIEQLSTFECKKKRITNLEMETAGIYGLAKILGHHAISFNAILANRATGEFSNQPAKTVKKLITTVLEKIENDI